jgi:hypothetical protein
MCLPRHAVGRIHLALRHGRQPVELVLIVVPEVQVAGARTPCGNLGGKADVDGDVVDLRGDLVGLEVTAE